MGASQMTLNASQPALQHLIRTESRIAEHIITTKLDAHPEAVRFRSLVRSRRDQMKTRNDKYRGFLEQIKLPTLMRFMREYSDIASKLDLS